MDETRSSAGKPIPYSKPDARDDRAWTREDKRVTIDLLDNDKDATGIWKINGRFVKLGDTIELKSGASVTVGKDGRVVYDPSDSTFDALDSGEFGFDTFRYSAFDNEFGTDTATVRVRIKGVNDAPVANDDFVFVPFKPKPVPYPEPIPLPAETASADASNDALIVTTLAVGEEGDPDPLPKNVTIAPLGNDKDVDGHDLTIAQINGKAVSPGDSVKLKSGAVVTVSQDGETLTYKGISGHLGPLRSSEGGSPVYPDPKPPSFTDRFTYRASDGDALSNTAEVTVAQGQVYYYDDLA